LIAAVWAHLASKSKVDIRVICSSLILSTLIETAKLSGRDSEAWLRDVLTRIADHPINRIDNLVA
jgi:hypothetical protein